jgi:pimeloyl-ACP methyl ester carboxylesterase
VLFNQLMDYFWEKVKQFFILGYLTGYIDTNKLTCPTVIIQWEYDKYGGINIVKENIIWNVDHITFHEITNANHSYYDIHNPSIRYIDQVNQIITNTIIKS